MDPRAKPVCVRAVGKRQINDVTGVTRPGDAAVTMRPLHPLKTHIAPLQQVQSLLQKVA